LKQFMSELKQFMSERPPSFPLTIGTHPGLPVEFIPDGFGPFTGNGSRRCDNSEIQSAVQAESSSTSNSEKPARIRLVARGVQRLLALATGRMLRGKARFRRSDLLEIVKTSGADALPIVTLISLLVGLILAFVGAVQLKLFGAEIYVASMVGISMVRVMGAFMTGIIMAGRTGAAFAAELGTMQVNEEIDALQTLGISPMEFLVLPRMVALCLMMPLLCVYADLMGILGGFIVGVSMLDISPMEYYNQTVESLTILNLWIGIFHGFVFGILIALSGCLRGMKCGRSASAVGTAATSAVVIGIVSIVVATAIITIACNVLGI